MKANPRLFPQMELVPPVMLIVPWFANVRFAFWLATLTLPDHTADGARVSAVPVPFR